MWTRTDPGSLTFFFNGEPFPAHPGDSAAAALLANGVHITRNTAVSGAPRGPYCMMGACFDCLAIVDGKPGVQTCLVPVRDGMRIERQSGARVLETSATTP